MFLPLSILIFSGVFHLNGDQYTSIGHDKPLFADSITKFRYSSDLLFLNNHTVVYELVDNDARIIVVPEFQGRVMTSTSKGVNGNSYGWINYKFIENNEINIYANPYGGEERIWLGPEGSNYSLFFKSDSIWCVPGALDREPFHVIDFNTKSINLNTTFSLINRIGNRFNGNILRSITILTGEDAQNLFEIKLPESIKTVGYQTRNELINVGTENWDRQTGTISIWLLAMLKASDNTTAVIPINQTEGTIIRDYYHNIPGDRLKINNCTVLFQVDGKFKSKIGLKQNNVLPFLGSYDAENKVLTIIQFNLPESKTDYVNSSFDYQEDPFDGDVINVYNDGTETGEEQLGKLYELETSSKAAFLKPGESIIHIQNTFHFEGEMNDLEFICKTILKTSIDDLTRFP